MLLPQYLSSVQCFLCQKISRFWVKGLFLRCIIQSPEYVNEREKEVVENCKRVCIKFILLIVSVQNKKYLLHCWYEFSCCAFWHKWIIRETWNCFFCNFFQFFSSFLFVQQALVFLNFAYWRELKIDPIHFTIPEVLFCQRELAPKEILCVKASVAVDTIASQ